MYQIGIQLAQRSKWEKQDFAANEQIPEVYKD